MVTRSGEVWPGTVVRRNRAGWPRRPGCRSPMTPGCGRPGLIR